MPVTTAFCTRVYAHFTYYIMQQYCYKPPSGVLKKCPLYPQPFCLLKTPDGFDYSVWHLKTMFPMITNRFPQVSYKPLSGVHTPLLSRTLPSARRRKTGKALSPRVLSSSNIRDTRSWAGVFITSKLSVFVKICRRRRPLRTLFSWMHSHELWFELE